jgi:hypothetical protein
VLAVGDTVKLPPLMVYVPAPVGVIVNELPEQMVALFTASVGVVFTDTVDTTVLTAAQPLAPVPVTEYVEVLPGVTVNVLPVTE